MSKPRITRSRARLAAAQALHLIALARGWAGASKGIGFRA